MKIVCPSMPESRGAIAALDHLRKSYAQDDMDLENEDTHIARLVNRVFDVQQKSPVATIIYSKYDDLRIPAKPISTTKNKKFTLSTDTALNLLTSTLTIITDAIGTSNP